MIRRLLAALILLVSVNFVSAQKTTLAKSKAATLDSGIIRNPKGEIAVNTNEYNFLKGDTPATVNPSLWRPAQVNAINGLFKVAEGFYHEAVSENILFGNSH